MYVRGLLNAMLQLRGCVCTGFIKPHVTVNRGVCTGLFNIMLHLIGVVCMRLFNPMLQLRGGVCTGFIKPHFTVKRRCVYWVN